MSKKSLSSSLSLSIEVPSHRPSSVVNSPSVPIVPLDADGIRNQLLKDAIQCIYRDNLLWLKLMVDGPAKQLQHVASQAAATLIRLEQKRILCLCRLRILEENIQTTDYMIQHISKYNICLFRQMWACNWEMAVEEAVSRYRMQIILAKRFWPSGHTIQPMTPLLANMLIVDFDDKLRDKLCGFPNFVLERKGVLKMMLSRPYFTKKVLCQVKTALDNLRCSSQSMLEFVESEIHETMDREGMRTLSYTEKVFNTAAKVLYVLMTRYPSALPDRFSFAYGLAKSTLSPRTRSSADIRHQILPKLESMLVHEMKILLENNVQTWWRDEDGNSLLHHAVISKQHEMVKYLIEQGATVSTFNQSGHTPLHLAFRSTREILHTVYFASEQDKHMRRMFQINPTRLNFFDELQNLLQNEEQKFKSRLFHGIFGSRTSTHRLRTIQIIRGKLSECRTLGHASVLVDYLEESWKQVLSSCRHSSTTIQALAPDQGILQAVVNLVAKYVVASEDCGLLESARSILGDQGLDADIENLRQKILIQGLEEHKDSEPPVETMYSSDQINEKNLRTLSADLQSEFFFEIEL